MLNRIEITGLYGHYSYDLPLKAGQRQNICFLTGPNGYGKSTILDLVYAFIKADAKALVDVPFDTVTFYMNDYKVSLKQERFEESDDSNVDPSGSDDDIPTVRELTIVVYSADNGEELERVVFNDYELDKNIDVFPKSLSVYLSSLNVEYLADDRLWPRNFEKLGVSECVSLLKRMISNYDMHLTAIYNENLLGAMHSLSPGSFDGKLEERLLKHRAEEKLIAFNRLGLATRLITRDQPEDNKHFLLSLQMAAVDAVLSFDDIFFKRLNLLYDIIEKSEFSEKELVLDAEHGLYFKSEDNIIIPENLSSGEQHFVIQLITLLMKAEPGSLILIDEPELSYHPAWQMDYLKNLKRIAEIGGFQFLLATHSPQIFDYRWRYTIDLYKQTTTDAEGIKERD